MEIKEVRNLLNPQFGYLAKSTGELLFAHHFAVWSIFRKISEYVPSLDNEEKYLLEIACLVHDIGKMDKDIQEALRKGKEPGKPHKINTPEQLISYLDKVHLQPTLTPENIKRIFDIITTHHSISQKDLEAITTSGAGFFTSLLSIADYLASMDRVSYETISKLNRIYKHITFTCVEYSRFPSPTAFLIVKEVVKLYKERNWEPLCFPEGSIIFVGEPNYKLPNKKNIVENIVKTIIEESLKIQDPIPKKFTEDHLTLLSKELPESFLNVHKDTLLEALGNIDQKHIVFLKLLRDILINTKEWSKQLEENKPLLRMINLANSRSGYPKVKEIFKELYKKSPPEKVNRDFFKPLFEDTKLNEVIPNDLDIEKLNLHRTTPLKNLFPKELFSILELTARISSSAVKQRLEEFISSCISMEEETDFKIMAETIFKKYKDYKKTSSAEKGCCERCGCPVSFKMQPSLKLRRASQAFSQIKPKYAYRAICPLCGYDHLVLRERITRNKVRIYLRIQTKIPDLFVNHDELKKMVIKIQSGVRIPRGIIKIIEEKELSNLPFPEKIEIPISNKELEIKNKLLISDNGLLIPLEDINDKDFSPKDAKAKYEPLYHITKFLGFKVAIGTEEQEGLFGEEIETNEQNYYKSLATILLAGIHEKKQKKYIFARTLLEKSPSVTLKSIGDSLKEKKISQGLITCLIKGMIKSKIIISKPRR